jgi:hypothetical protein
MTTTPDTTPKKRSAATARILAAKRELSSRMIDVRVYFEIDEPETITVKIGARDEIACRSKGEAARVLEEAARWL